MRAFCSALKKCKNVCPCNPQGQFGLEKGGTFWLFPFWGKPGTHRKTLGVNLTQGSREAQRKRYYLSPIQPLSQNLRFSRLPLHRGAGRHSVNAITCRRYNPSVKTCGFASSPCTGEPRMCAEARAVSGEGAENAPQNPWREPYTGEPRAALRRSGATFSPLGEVPPQRRKGL